MLCCCADLQPLLAVSVWLAAGTEGATADILPLPRTFLRHSSSNCTPLPSWLLHHLRAEEFEALEIGTALDGRLDNDQLLFQRERGGSSAMFCVAGEGIGLCLANLASLILSSSKQGHQR